MSLKLVKRICLIQHSLSVSSRWLKCNAACVDSHCSAVNCGGTGLGGCPPYQRQVSVFNDGNERHQIGSLGVNEVNKLGFSQRKERESTLAHIISLCSYPQMRTLNILRYLWRVVLCVVTENKTMTQSPSEPLGSREMTAVFITTFFLQHTSTQYTSCVMSYAQNIGSGVPKSCTVPTGSDRNVFLSTASCSSSTTS